MYWFEAQFFFSLFTFDLMQFSIIYVHSVWPKGKANWTHISSKSANDKCFQIFRCFWFFSLFFSTKPHMKRTVGSDIYLKKIYGQLDFSRRDRICWLLILLLLFVCCVISRKAAYIVSENRWEPVINKGIACWVCVCVSVKQYTVTTIFFSFDDQMNSNFNSL